MKKRIISLALMSVFAIGILAGCGSTGQTGASDANNAPETVETDSDISIDDQDDIGAMGRGGEIEDGEEIIEDDGSVIDKDSIDPAEF